MAFKKCYALSAVTTMDTTEGGRRHLKIGTSIRKQLYIVLALTAFLCISVVLVSGLSTREVIQSARALFTSNSTLSDFYTTVEKMDASARDWVYSGEAEDYRSYQHLAQLARNDLEQISTSGDVQLAWRLSRLENMLDYYHKPLDEFRAGKRSAYETYNELAYRCRLIRNTTTKYYTYLAEYLQSNAETIQARWKSRWMMQLVTLSLFALAGIAVSGYYSKSILRPIQIMMENARRIQKGDFNLKPIGQASAELAVMANTFSEMAGQVEKNMDVLKENAQLEQMLLREESEHLAMQNLVTQAELRSLQAQINPHFLFNTLSMISKSAYLSQDTTTSELIDRLAGFLRYALDKSSTTSTLREEINSIENYLFIQKKRFSGRLDFLVDVAEQVPNLKMPAIVLQPLVENAIQHGIGPLAEEMVISLKVRNWDGRVRIQIEDNGIGMSAEQLETLQSCLKLGLESSSRISGTGIGLTNVYRRLKIYYGNDVQFNIESEENCGTLITISLPSEVES